MDTGVVGSPTRWHKTNTGRSLGTPDELAALVDRCIRSNVAQAPEMDPLLAAYATGRILLEDIVRQEVAAGGGCECRAGCSHCCTLRNAPEAPRYEAEIVAIHMRQTWEPDHFERVRAQVREVAAALRALPVDEYLDGQCPLLDTHGHCSIYSVRPTMCLTYHAGPASHCKSGGLIEIMAGPVAAGLVVMNVVDQWSDGLPHADFISSLSIELDRGTPEEVPGLEPRPRRYALPDGHDMRIVMRPRRDNPTTGGTIRPAHDGPNRRERRLMSRRKR